MSGNQPRLAQLAYRALRKHLRVWAKHTVGHYKKEKKRLIDLIDKLDKKAETTPLTDNEINYKHYLKESLVTLLREEESKWYERAKVKTLLEGDNNTKFFRLVANGKHHKQHIFKLENEDGMIIGDEQLKAHITTYYKGLFGPPDESSFTLVEDRVDDTPQVSDAENEILTAPFSEKEVKDVVLEHNKSPGPDGFPAEFYQVFWKIIKGDLLALF